MEDKDVAEAESNEKEGSEDGSDDVDGGNLNDGDLDETESAVEDAESEEREGGTESEQDDGVHVSRYGTYGRRDIG